MIMVKNLSKVYGRRIILKDINIEIEKGTVVAVQGNNGCGKSTFLKIIGGIVRTTEGEVVYPESCSFAYIPEHFPRLPVTPEAYLKKLCQIDSNPEGMAEAERLFRRFQMEEYWDKPLRYLSKGTLQKVGVVQAFITGSDVLLMDEPLSGQDRESQQVFTEEVRCICERGTTVLLSCHEEWLRAELADKVYEIREKGMYETEEVYHEADTEDDWIFWTLIQKNK